METSELGDMNGDKTVELLTYIQLWIGGRRPWRCNEREIYRVMSAALHAELYNIRRMVCGRLPQLGTAGREQLDQLAEGWMRMVRRDSVGDYDLSDCDRVAGAVLAARAREDGLDP